jgi:hypothetical protein
MAECHIVGAEYDFSGLAAAGPQEPGCSMRKIDNDIAVIGVDPFGAMQDPGRMAAHRIPWIGSDARYATCRQPPTERR